MSDPEHFAYDDGRIACSDSNLVIRLYYPWGTAKRIPYERIRSVKRRQMGTWGGRLRIWGSGDFKHWFNLDARRPRKNWALVINTGNRVEPVITPDDVDKVIAVLRDHAVDVDEG